MPVSVLKSAELPWDAIANELVGDDHGLGVCLIFVDAEPGRGPAPHRHPYEEVLVVLEGRATLDDGEQQIDVGAGDVMLIPANQPHGFVNSGDGPLRQLDIHVSPRFVTEWLDE